MKPRIIYLLFILAGLVPAHRCFAQCPDPGYSIHQVAEAGPIVYAMGDAIVTASGINPADASDADWYLGPAARVDMYAGITINSGAVLRLKAGAVLNVYGNFTNNGYLFVEPGATLNFFGKVWTNSPTAVVGNELAITTIPGGEVNFIAPRPQVPGAVGATSCVLLTYSGGNFAQSMDGGNVPMNITLQVRNNNNIELINTNTKIAGNIVFAIPDGDIALGDHDLVFTRGGAYYWSIANAYDAYMVTNGTPPCKGMVQKDSLAPGHNFVFPIGNTERDANGNRNFSPAAIQNDGSAATNVKVYVKTYAQSAAEGVVYATAPVEGMDKTWKVISSSGGAVTADFEHRVTATGTSYEDMFTLPVTGKIEQYANSSTLLPGKKPKGMGSGTSSIFGEASRIDGAAGFDSTAQNCVNTLAWFIKTVDVNALIKASFTAKADSACGIHLQYSLYTEAGLSSQFIDRFSNSIQQIRVQRQLNGSTANSFSSLGIMEKDSLPGQYHFTDRSPYFDSDQYRLQPVFMDSSTAYSNVLSAQPVCPEVAISIAPNPTDGISYITGLTKGQVVQLLGVNGQVLSTKAAVSNRQQIDIRKYAKAVYLVRVLDNKKRVAAIKLMKLK